MPKFTGRVEFPCTIELGRGLEGAITNVTQIGYVDGEAGKLNYRGYQIEDLCAHCNFEETAYLLIHGKLPTQGELSAFAKKLRPSRAIPGPIADFIRSLPRDAHPMNVLQATMAAMAAYDAECLVVTEHTSDPATIVPVETEVAIRAISWMPTLAGAIARAQRGKDFVPPDPGISFTANYVYMTTGERPSRVTERVMDVCLVLQADHGMNASTFTAMVVHSSLSDMYATMSAAIGSLRGPLHGGANEAALEDIQKIGGPAKAAAWVADRLSKGQKIIGFGHRVYKAYDPRATVLKEHARALCKEKGMTDLFDTAAKVEEEVCRAMEKAGKKIYPNVDFYSGIVYHALGFDTPQFPVIFAVGRSAGWAARVLEYLPENRIFRPRAAYNGPAEVKVTPIGQR